MSEEGHLSTVPLDTLLADAYQLAGEVVADLADCRGEPAFQPHARNAGTRLLDLLDEATRRLAAEG